jgi:hypothetical protein
MAIELGKFSRVQISSSTGVKPKVLEGRWYGEINRTAKYGEQFDWRTRLNVMVM